MYSRRRLLIATMASCAMAMATPAMAQDDRVTRGVLRQLERQGFEIERINRTWLGRVRILASRRGQSRELVVDPRNGAILRDFISDDDDDDRPRIPDIRDHDDDEDRGRDDAALGDKDRDEDMDNDEGEDDRDKNDEDEGGGDDESDDDE